MYAASPSFSLLFLLLSTVVVVSRINRNRPGNVAQLTPGSYTVRWLAFFLFVRWPMAREEYYLNFLRAPLVFLFIIRTGEL